MRIILHALIDLPTNLSIEQVVQLLKGGSSHGDQSQPSGQGQVRVGTWLRSFLGLPFRLGPRLQIHLKPGGPSRKRTFDDEYELFVKRYGLQWRDEANR